MKSLALFFLLLGGVLFAFGGGSMVEANSSIKISVPWYTKVKAGVVESRVGSWIKSSPRKASLAIIGTVASISVCTNLVCGKYDDKSVAERVFDEQVSSEQVSDMDVVYYNYRGSIGVGQRVERNIIDDGGDVVEPLGRYDVFLPHYFDFLKLEDFWAAKIGGPVDRLRRHFARISVDNAVSWDTTESSRAVIGKKVYLAAGGDTPDISTKEDFLVDSLEGLVFVVFKDDSYGVLFTKQKTEGGGFIDLGSEMYYIVVRKDNEKLIFADALEGVK